MRVACVGSLREVVVRPLVAKEEQEDAVLSKSVSGNERLKVRERLDRWSPDDSALLLFLREDAADRVPPVNDCSVVKNQFRMTL